MIKLYHLMQHLICQMATYKLHFRIIINSILKLSTDVLFLNNSALLNMVATPGSNTFIRLSKDQREFWCSNSHLHRGNGNTKCYRGHGQGHYVHQCATRNLLVELNEGKDKVQSVYIWDGEAIILLFVSYGFFRL